MKRLVVYYSLSGNTEEAAEKVTSLFFLSGGETEKRLEAITKLLPNLKNSVSLLDRKHKDSAGNEAKIEEFIDRIK